MKWKPSSLLLLLPRAQGTGKETVTNLIILGTFSLPAILSSTLPILNGRALRNCRGSYCRVTVLLLCLEIHCSRLWMSPKDSIATLFVQPRYCQIAPALEYWNSSDQQESLRNLQTFLSLNLSPLFRPFERHTPFFPYFVPRHLCIRLRLLKEVSRQNFFLLKWGNHSRNWE